MAQLHTKVKLYLKANSKTWEDTKVSLQNDGDGDYIKTFIYDGLAKPTDEQLASYETEGNTVETNVRIDATRQIQFLSWQEQMDMQYHDAVNGTTTWKDAIAKVKADNPKSED